MKNLMYCIALAIGLLPNILMAQEKPVIQTFTFEDGASLSGLSSNGLWATAKGKNSEDETVDAHPYLLDVKKGTRKYLLTDEEIKETYAKREPYGEWLDRNLVNLADLKIPNERVPSHEHDELVRLQKAFGYQYEDVSTMILPMAKNGAEPAGVVGDAGALKFTVTPFTEMLPAALIFTVAKVLPVPVMLPTSVASPFAS